MNSFAKIAVALLAAALPAGCGGTAPRADPPLAGARIGGPFALTDQDGRTVRDSDFRGKYRIIYFGYTFCPDICPVDVQNIAAALKQLAAADPAHAARIVPIFITVDPERDTPAALKQFVRSFSPTMVGLTGSPEVIARTAKAFAIFYQKQPPSGAGGYLVNHSRQAYLFDPDGKPMALLPQDQSAQAVVAELNRWVP